MTSTRTTFELKKSLTSIQSIAARLASQNPAMASRAPRPRTAVSKDARRPRREAGAAVADAVGWAGGLLVVVIGAESTQSFIPLF